MTIAPTATVLAIGSEITSGKIVDTNSSFLCAELAAIGISVKKICSVPDERELMAEAILSAARATGLVIITGGLGPTTDDFTKEVIAEVLKVPLEEDEASIEKLKIHAEKRGRKLKTNSLRQALFPKGATIIENTKGTANASMVEAGSIGFSRLIVSLPGVPLELKTIWHQSLKSLLLEHIADVTRKKETFLKFFGRAEATLGHVIEQLELPRQLEISYRPSFPEVLVTLGVDESDVADSLLVESAEKIIRAVGEEYLIGTEMTAHLNAVLGDLLESRNETLAASESCTGGAIAHNIVSLAGSSNYFLSSVVSYSNASKEAYLSVSGETLLKFGAVSREVAIEMAKGAREKSAATYGLSTTGIAGPDGGSDDKPVGTVWIGLATPEGVQAYRFVVNMERNGFRKFVAFLALDLLRRFIKGHPVNDAILNENY